ncbi:MAG TPA: secretin N-terminal domain-containing protein [Chthoniobacterales bacterium]|jgi:type IV pilus assembly protein PilQ|nr:secretin N-terminal domain-containing protein [Chthoniobacterales bacterium]
MATSFKQRGCVVAAAFLTVLSLSQAQTNPAPAAGRQAPDQTKPADQPPMLMVQAPVQAATPAPNTNLPATTQAPVLTEADANIESGGVGVREFQGDDVGQVLRLLARQAKVNMVVSEAVIGTVTMRLEDVTALQAISIIVKAKGLFMDKLDNVYYIKTPAEKTAEPTESDSYQFSYARAKDVSPLIASQLSSKSPPQIDERTNTMFYSETRSNIDNIRKVLLAIDKPTKQVMIEARLVEVTADPVQAYGINWAGTVGSATAPKTVSYGMPSAGASPVPGANPPTQGFALGNPNNTNFFGSLGHLLPGTFAILSAPQFSATLSALNEDSDAEFLANPRVVTADNQQAKIEVLRNQPIPQLNFNEQTATAVFGGFQDKLFGNTLVVRPSINKDNYITLSVKPEISNKVADFTFTFNGANVTSPIIDKRSLDSNVLIKSGDTLAIGGLLSDQVSKARTKVPILGDIPFLGNAFQSHDNERHKRNLLIFVTPTIIDQHYGTGLEDQVSGLRHTGEEYADPNGWRNNAKGAVRLIPTAHRQIAADYAKPGSPPAVEESPQVEFKSDVKDRNE